MNDLITLIYSLIKIRISENYLKPGTYRKLKEKKSQ